MSWGFSETALTGLTLFLGYKGVASDEGFASGLGEGFGDVLEFGGDIIGGTIDYIKENPGEVTAAAIKGYGAYLAAQKESELRMAELDKQRKWQLEDRDYRKQQLTETLGYTDPSQASQSPSEDMQPQGMQPPRPTPQAGQHDARMGQLMPDMQMGSITTTDDLIRAQQQRGAAWR